MPAICWYVCEGPARSLAHSHVPSERSCVGALLDSNQQKQSKSLCSWRAGRGESIVLRSTHLPWGHRRGWT